MPHTPPDINATAEFSRPVAVADLPGQDGFDFDIAPDLEERAALARLLGANSVRKLRFSGRISPEGEDALRLRGKLGATVIQPCVVTLAPVTTRIDVTVDRLFIPPADSEEPELVIDPQDDSDTDILASRIDLGLIATETVAIALPDYPRAPGVEFEPAAFAAPGITPLTDEEARPFSQLAELRDKLKN
jgi:uncharacterized metal-binding protein YceD (DUF177 family)